MKYGANPSCKMKIEHDLKKKLISLRKKGYIPLDRKCKLKEHKTFIKPPGNLLNPFHATDLFLYPRKTSENLRFSDVFRGYRKRPVAWNMSRMFTFRPRSRGWAKVLYFYIQFINGKKNWPHAEAYPGYLQTSKMESFLTIIYGFKILL